METVKKAVGARGVAVYNLCAKKPAFFAVCRRQFAGVFAQVHSMQTEDVNQMFLLTDRAVLTTKEAADAQRTEETKTLLPDFVFPSSFSSLCSTHACPTNTTKTAYCSLILILFLLTATPIRFLPSTTVLVSLSTT